MENILLGKRIANRKTMREEIYKLLKKSIIHGKLKGGQRLVEGQLGHQLGISRTPVREAFHKLERDELVTRLSKGGFVVKEFTKEDVEEIFGIRSALESYAAYLAAVHISKERILTLEKKIEETEKAMKNSDNDKVVQLHTEFHDLLYDSCKSKKLIEMINNFRDFFYRYRPALLSTEKNIRDSNEDHRRMLEAMKKNPRLVESIVRKHLAKGKKIIMKRLTGEK